MKREVCMWKYVHDKTVGLLTVLGPASKGKGDGKVTL